MLEVILALILVALVILIRDIHLLMSLNNEVAKNQLYMHERLDAILESLVRVAEAQDGQE